MPRSIFSPDVQAAFARARTPRTVSVTVGGSTVAVPTPFPSPADWRDCPIYFLLLDRFDNPAAPPRLPAYDAGPRVFAGGTFNGVRQRLDYLAGLGVGALWLSPVLKNCQYRPDSYHGYGVQDFLGVEPRFASDPAAAAVDPSIAERELRALVDEAHARGLYVIFDVVLNHVGDVFEYDVDGGRDKVPWRPTAYPVRWRDETGAGRADWPAPPPNPHPDASVWPVELARDELFRRQGMGFEDGGDGDFEALKELVTDRQDDPDTGPPFPVRHTLIRAHQQLIARYDVDGFRIDTLKYIEPDFARVFASAMREYALSIGKRDFFTFGEVYDGEEKIAKFIGRNTVDGGEVTGVDAALDFPLFFTLPGVVKGMRAPSEVGQVYARRRQALRHVISSHGDASGHFVTFVENHDQRSRFSYVDPADPDRYADQLTLAMGALFSLPGIPCLYYGSEQGLHGAGPEDTAVREALWGMPGAFDPSHPYYQALASLAAVRATQPALRYGRMYQRQVSGDGVHFGVSTGAPGVLAYSRVLNEEEVVVVANTDPTRVWAGEVIVDRGLNPAGSAFAPVWSNIAFGPAGRPPRTPQGPGLVRAKLRGQVQIAELDGRVSDGPASSLPVVLAPMEAQVLARA